MTTTSSHSVKCSHQMFTMDEAATKQVGLLGVVETYRCDEPGCNGSYQIRSWAEAEDSGFAPEYEDDEL